MCGCGLSRVYAPHLTSDVSRHAIGPGKPRLALTCGCGERRARFLLNLVTRLGTPGPLVDAREIWRACDYNDSVVGRGSGVLTPQRHVVWRRHRLRLSRGAASCVGGHQLSRVPQSAQARLGNLTMSIESGAKLNHIEAITAEPPAATNACVRTHRSSRDLGLQHGRDFSARELWRQPGRGVELAFVKRHVDVSVDAPAAWFWLPSGHIAVVDPDIDDDPPRYSSELEGGWKRVGDVVVNLLRAVERRVDSEALSESTKLTAVGRLSPQQEWIVFEWFSGSASPQIDPRYDSWINGRHRSWGLAEAGFAAIPVLHLCMGDLVHFWHRDPEVWGTLDADSLREQREQLQWWREAPDAAQLREMNPCLPNRWSQMLAAWEARLGVS